MEVYDILVKEELFGYGYIYKIKLIRIEDLL